MRFPSPPPWTPPRRPALKPPETGTHMGPNKPHRQPSRQFTERLRPLLAGASAAAAEPSTAAPAAAEASPKAPLPLLVLFFVPDTESLAASTLPRARTSRQALAGCALCCSTRARPPPLRPPPRPALKCPTTWVLLRDPRWRKPNRA